ncbi:MAG: site-2 protease family protein [Anaerolineales bacterium]|jgi:membrane-associated protease RseP (regulator of RpoE activity)
MQIDDVTRGDRQRGFSVRFRGRLVGSSDQAFDLLEPAFERMGMTLLFREESQQHVILGVDGLVRPGPSDSRINIALFVITLLSVIYTGVVFANVSTYSAAVPQPNLSTTEGIVSFILGGLPFGLALMAILLAHEFGHYLAARHHKTSVTLPYFLPLPPPLSPLGTLGAFIRLKSLPKNRKHLLDIGLAGPLAGFVVAVPILLVGVYLSKVMPLPAGPSSAGQMMMEGNSLLYLAAKYVIKGQLLPAPVSFGGIAPFMYWLRYFFSGSPIPYGGQDIIIHPLAWAGWAGLLVTALNLLPAGQLDGGHLVYVLFGRKVSMAWPIIVVALVGMGFIWSGWWIWAALVFFLGRSHAEPLDEITPLDPGRRLLALLGLAIFVLTFTPVPLVLFG